MNEIDLSGMILSLAFVVGLILAAAFVFRRTPFSLRGRNSGPLKIVASLPLGPKERLLLVHAGEHEVLVAVSSAGISIVGTAGLAPRTVSTLAAENANVENGSFEIALDAGSDA